MTAAAFRAALARLGWTQSTASARLGVANRQRVSEWARGKRAVPGYVAAAVRAHLELHRLAPEGSDSEGLRPADAARVALLRARWTYAEVVQPTEDPCKLCGCADFIYMKDGTWYCICEEPEGSDSQRAPVP